MYLAANTQKISYIFSNYNVTDVIHKAVKESCMMKLATFSDEKYKIIGEI